MREKILKALCMVIVLVMTISLLAVNASAITVSISKKSIKLYKNTSYTLKVNGISSEAAWSSSDDKIATVSKSGKVTAKAAGKCYVYAKTGETTLKCLVEVIDQSVSVSENKLEFEKPGQQKSIICTVAAAKKSVGVKLSSGNVVSVKCTTVDSSSLKLTIVSKLEGSATIQVYLKSNPKIIQEINVTVKKSSKALSVIEEEKNTADCSYMINGVFEIVNAERKAKGIDSLILDELLCKAADIRAKELSTKFSHTRPDETICFTVLTEVGFKVSSAGENIAAGQRSAQDVMDSWMGSPMHKENIMSSQYKKIGIGCYKDGDSYYWVQIFSD